MQHQVFHGHGAARAQTDPVSTGYVRANSLSYASKQVAISHARRASCVPSSPASGQPHSQVRFVTFASAVPASTTSAAYPPPSPGGGKPRVTFAETARPAAAGYPSSPAAITRVSSGHYSQPTTVTRVNSGHYSSPAAISRVNSGHYSNSAAIARVSSGHYTRSAQPATEASGSAQPTVIKTVTTQAQPQPVQTGYSSTRSYASTTGSGGVATTVVQSTAKPVAQPAPKPAGKLAARRQRPVVKPIIRTTPRAPEPGSPDYSCCTTEIQQPSSSRNELDTSMSQKYSWEKSTPTDLEARQSASWMLDTISQVWNRDPGSQRFWWQEAEIDSLFKHIETLCLAAKKVMKADPYPMLQITSPVCVLGDIHGSFDDLQFFLTQLYDADGPEPSPPGDTRSEREHQLATHVLVLRDDGDHEVAGILDIERSTSKSTANLATLKRQKSEFSMQMGNLKSKQLLFLGDFVDRGMASVEVILYVLALKVLFTKHVHLLRGNHELEKINAVYGFQGACEQLFGDERGDRVWWMVSRVFDDLPLAAVLDGKIFCAHGGIPRMPATGADDRMALLADQEAWRRFRDGPSQVAALKDPAFRRHAEVFEDLLWADPAEPERGLNDKGFRWNDVRGCSVAYGKTAVDAFLKDHGFTLLMRAHEKTARGFHLCKSGQVITVFTSSRYGGQTNCAGVVLVDPKTVRMITRSFE